jgi:hypothetical protein
MSKATESLEIRQIRKLRSLLAQNEASLFYLRSTLRQSEKRSSPQTIVHPQPAFLSN